MITIHAQDTTDFDNNGLGVLEPTSCDFNVTINGVWSLELEHPLDDEKIYDNDGVNKIAKNNIIKIPNPQIINEQTSPYQLFRIYDTVHLLSTIKAIAFPIALEATYDAIIEELKTDKKTATATLADIMTYLRNHGVTKYTVESDYTQDGVVPRQKKGSWSSTNLIAAISGSDDGSIINHWGGEVVYDNYKIIVNGKLGTFGDTMYCNPSYRFASAFWHSQAYESGYHQQDYNYKKATGEDAIIAIDNSHNFMLVSCISQTAVDWVWQRLEYDSASGAWIYGTWQDPIYSDVYGLYTPCYRESSFTYKGKTWWVSWGYMDTYYNTPFVTASHVLDGRSTGDIVGNAKALIDLSGWNPKTPDKYECRVGKNIAGLSVDTDISGVATRLYPVSEDNVRLKRTVDDVEVSYVDSDGEQGHIQDYPYVRSAFIKAPFRLIDTTWEGTTHTDTQIATKNAIDAIYGKVVDVAAELWQSLNEGTSWHGKWYEPEWIQDILNDVSTQCQKDITANITHPTWKALIQSCIKQGLSYIKDQEVPDYYWELVTGSSDVYCYTNGLRTLLEQYAYVDKRYCWFNAAGNYEPWWDISYMDWIQPKGSNDKKKYYGDNQRYYARNSYVYIYNQAGDTFCEYWFDDEGWWDNVSETETDWAWHQSGSKWWFGESSATSSQKSKYAHDCWLYIDDHVRTAGLYYFDSDGYSDETLTKTNTNWGWQSVKVNGLDANAGKYYFGSTNKDQYKVLVESQWLKVDGMWRKFKDDGTLTDMKVLKTQFTTLLKNNLASELEDVITYHQNYLYDLLYTSMIQYCLELYEAGLDTPTISVTADIVELSKMKGYEDFAKFEQAHLGNDVQIHDYYHNIHRTERIVGLKYDCIREYNTEITIGAKSVYWEKIGASISTKNTGKKIETIEMGQTDTNNYEGLTAGVGINIDANGVISADNIVGDVFGGTEVSYDPSITTGTLLGTIYINGVGYGIYAEGGGSDVSITPRLQSGTKVADYEIDGVNGSLYAPTPTTYTAGQNVSINNGEISATDTTYNDFVGGSHGLVPDVSSQQGKFLKDDGTWDTPSGGTAVEANPSGEPTDTLLSVKIGNVIYDIPSGEVTTNIKEYNSQKYTFMYESGQDAAFSTVDGDMLIQTVLDPSYSASDYKAEIVRVVPIPTTVKKIRYKLEFGYQTYRESNTDEWKYCVGVKSTLDTTNYASPTDNDFIVKKLYSKEDYENSIIDDELILDGTTQTYLYFIGRGWNCEITKLEVVEVGTVMELSGLDDVNITNPSNGQTIVFNGTSGKWENQTPSGGGGSTITYGTSEPSGSANDGDVYYLLKNDKLQATFLYKVNQWILIEGNVGFEGVHIWTHSTGGNDASMWMQHGYYNPSTGVFVPDQNEIDIKYQDVYQHETTYYDMVSLYYGNWQCKAKTEMTDGTNTYANGSMIKSWQFNETVDFTVWRTT